MTSLRSRLSRLWRGADRPERRNARVTPAPAGTDVAPSSGRREHTSPTSGHGTPSATPAAYPGDYVGIPDLTYAPQPDGRPDPGEIVWTWVPYEEDHRQGKDRPVLLIARDGEWLLALMLTSKDHDRDHVQEASRGRHWQDIGSGAWDGNGRPSEVRVDRILRVDPTAVRREGAVLGREQFERVAAAVRAAT